MGTTTTGGGGSSTFGEFRQNAQPGIMVALSCFTDADLEHNFQTFCCIGIKSSDVRLESRSVELAAGYIREEQGITWTGFYPIRSNDQLYLFARGNLNPVIYLTQRTLTGETLIIPGVKLSELLRTTA